MTTWTDEKKAEASRLWHEEKLSYAAIGRELDVTPGSIAGVAHRMKWERRRRKVAASRPRKKKEEKAVAVKRPAENLVATFNGRKINTKQVQFGNPGAKMTRSEMEAMLRQAVINTAKMEE